MRCNDSLGRGKRYFVFTLRSLADKCMNGNHFTENVVNNNSSSVLVMYQF